jgi:hypothetical protein
LQVLWVAQSFHRAERQVGLVDHDQGLRRSRFLRLRASEGLASQRL